ncbi:hypothetical protein JT146_07810 [Helicobacter pylori]|nr:hypothetical protein [Helicobacter pylori]
MIKKVLKFVLIKDSDKDGGLVAWWDRFRLGCKTLQGGIKITFPLITLKKPPLKSSFFHFVMKHPNTRDIWDFCLGGFKEDFYRFYR